MATIEKKKKWMGSPPDRCDLCREPMGAVFYDASVPRCGGSWGMVCSICFTDNACTLGLGYGQKYDTATLEKLGG